MLDDHHSIASVHQSVQHIQKLLDVSKVHTCGGFVQYIYGLAGSYSAKFLRQLDPLRLSTGQCGRRLSQLDVVQSHVMKRPKDPRHSGHVLEVFQRLLDVHIQHLGDVLALVPHHQRFIVEPGAAAYVAFHPYVWQEVHLDFLQAVAATCFTPADFDVKAESARLEAPHLGFRQPGKKSPDNVQDFHVSGRV